MKTDTFQVKGIGLFLAGCFCLPPPLLQNAGQHLLDLEVPSQQQGRLKALAAKIKVEDTPGNICKILCVGETLLFGRSQNAASHSFVVEPSSEAAELCKKHIFYN